MCEKEKGLKKDKKNEYKKVILDFKTNNPILIVLTLFCGNKKGEKGQIGKKKKGLKRWQRITDINQLKKKTVIWAIGVFGNSVQEK